jgi:hypothetical protein
MSAIRKLSPVPNAQDSLRMRRFQQAVLAGVALGSQVITSILGDPKTIRQTQISKSLERSQFYTPVAMNVSRDISGGYSDYERFGNVRSSSLSPYPSVEEPYYLFRQHQLVPGRTDSPYSVLINNNINALDPQSFADFATRNSGVMTDAVAHGVNTHGGTALIEANAAEALTRGKASNSNLQNLKIAPLIT